MRKQAGISLLVVAIVLIFSVCGWAKELRYSYHFSIPNIAKGVEGTLLEIADCPDCINISPWREPMLPTKGLKLLIPYGYELDRVEVVAGKAVEISLPDKIQYSPRQYPLSYTGPELADGPKASIYESDRPYPGIRHGNVMVQHKMGYDILVLNLFPVDYLPALDLARFYPDMTLVIHLKEKAKGEPRSIAVRDLDSDRRAILHVIDNPEVLGGYPKYIPASKEGKLPKDDYRYVIIAPNQFIGLAGDNTLEDLASSKVQQGFTTNIVSVEWILSNYSGRDDAEKVRNFVIDAYNNWSTEYILLVGDADKSVVGGETEAPLVPRRDLWSSSAYGYTDNLPADMYFVCLDGDFNYDGDGTWGEPNDGEGGGEVDLMYELYVGRFCVDSEAELRNAVRKTLAYFSYGPGESFMKSALMAGELLWSEPTWGGDYKDEIKNGSDNWGYTTVGFPGDWTVNTLYDRDGTWPASQLIDIINTDTYVVINHLGHCNVNYCLKLYNDDVDNDFANGKWFFAYSQGCYPGSFDNRGTGGSTYSYDCIAEHFTTGDNGMFAFVGNARYGWGQHSSTNGSSQYFDRQFFDAIFGEDIYELGHINADSKEDNIPFLDYGANRWCYFELNLFGDPQAPLGRTVFKDGMLAIDKSVYADGEQILVSVADSDLDVNSGQPDQITVNISTDCGDSEDVVLTETGNASAMFTGTIILKQLAAQPGNGQLEAQHNDVITVSYYDADTGHGSEWKYTYADADFMAPDFAGLSSATAGESQVTLLWNPATDDHEPVTYYIFRSEESGDYDFDSPIASTQDTTYVDTDLLNYYTYFYIVRAQDTAGNRDDNTAEDSARPTGPIPFFVEDFEYDKSFTDWTVVDLNEDGITWTDLNPGEIDSNYVEGTFASCDAGHYLFTPFDEELISPVIDASFFTEIALKFSHEFEKDSLAEKGFVLSSTDGTNWEELEKFKDDAAGIESFELGPTYDQAQTIYLKFHYLNKPHLLGKGFWALDDIELWGRPIMDPAPMADFEGSPTSGYAPLTVNFTAEYAGLIDNRVWEFGDGQTSMEGNPTHTFSDPGTYTVILTASGPYGSYTETKEDYIEVLSEGDDDDSDDDANDDDTTGDDDSGGGSDGGGCGCGF